MKKLFTLLLAVAASVGTMFAEKVQIGDLHYNLNGTSQTAEVTYKSYNNYHEYNEDWGITTANIPASVTYSDVVYSVTSIGGSAFRDCSGLTSVTIPNSVTSIGSSAFEGCRGLTLVTIPGSVTSIGSSAFAYCSGLTAVTIPNSVTSIGSSAFAHCSGLNSIIVENGNTTYDSRENCNAIIETASNTLIAGCKNTIIPNSVTSIGQSAFYYCDGLTSVTIPNSVTSIGVSAFADCRGLTSVTIPNSVTSIGYSAFVECTGLTSVTIGNSVTSIGSSAFNGCTGLTSVTIGNSVTSIGDHAFYNCRGLTSVHISDIAAWCIIAFSGSYSNPLYYANHLYLNDVEVTDLVIPNSVTRIGSYAFYKCTGLTSVTIPNSVTSIGSSAFEGCRGLTLVTIPGSVTSIGSSAFAYCSGLTSLTIGNSVTSIGGRAFYNCTGLTSVTIPNSVTSIGDYAFYGCTGLTSIEIPNSVTSIGEYAFSGCKGLTSVTIPNSVTSIGKDAFNNCTKLNTVKWNARACTTEFSSSRYGVFGGSTVYGNRYASPIEVFVIGDGVEIIPNGLLGGLELLSTIEIPNSVTSIGSNAFSGCTKLNTIKSMCFIPPTLGEDVFSQIASNTQLYVPQGSETLYQQDEQWNNFTSILPYRASYKINGLYYTLNAGNNEAELTYENLTDTNYNSQYKVIIPQSVTYKELSFDITSICDSAFVNCSSLNTVSLPIGIQSIGKDAFLGAGLTSVEWKIKSYPDFSSVEETPFYNSMKNIKSFTFGNEVENIPAYLCNGMVELETISLPNSLTSIGDYAFADINSRKFNSVVFPHSVASLGKGAFANDIYLENIEFGDDMEFIGEDAFKGCSRVLTMTSWSEFTPNVATGALDDIKSAAELYVRSSCLRKYEIDDNWNRFLLKEIGATETTMDVNDVTVEPSDNTALFRWPTNTNAATYTITITKEGEVFCTLVFNANGQLTGIAFAPGRNGARQAHAAIVSNGGMQFTVTGLDIATRYDFTLKTQDETANVLAEYTGSFGTTGAAEGLYDLQSDQVQNTKILHNGQIFILRGDKTYTLTGQEVK